jgi:hypothetical protein
MVPGATIRLSIRNEVVLPKQTEQLALFLSSRTSIDAAVVIRKLTGEDGMALPAPAEIDRLPVLYTGPAIDSIALTLTTPKFPGSYEIDIESAGKSVAERKLVLFVQNP